MRFLSTKVHGVLDYLMGLVLISSPWIFGFDEGGAEARIPMILGIGVILYSLLTDYELGAYRTLSMRTHLWLDGISGLFLAASPWLFAFSDTVYMPHLVLGLAEFLASVTTEKVPRHEEHRTRTHARSVRRKHSHA